MMEIVSNFMNSVRPESVAKSIVRYPTTTRHPTATRHPEFISGSNEILNQVQHDEGGIVNQVQHDEGGIVNQVQHDECGEIMYDLVNTVHPEPVEGQGGVVHASTSSARIAKVLVQKRLTNFVEGQVMHSYFDKLSTSGVMA